MVRFQANDSPGFRTAMAALKRYAQDALGVTESRVVDAKARLSSIGWQKATELARGVQVRSPNNAIESGMSFGQEEDVPAKRLLQA